MLRKTRSAKFEGYWSFLTDNPNLGQTIPKDSASAHDPPPTDTYHQPKQSGCKEEGVSTPKLEQDQFDVKEVKEVKPKSSTVGGVETAQASQSSQRQSSDPTCEAHYQDTSRGPCEAPWIYAMNEQRSVQHAVELRRSRMDGDEAHRDAMELREGLDNLSKRIGRL